MGIVVQHENGAYSAVIYPDERLSVRTPGGSLTSRVQLPAATVERYQMRVDSRLAYVFLRPDGFPEDGNLPSPNDTDQVAGIATQLSVTTVDNLVQQLSVSFGPSGTPAGQRMRRLFRDQVRLQLGLRAIVDAGVVIGITGLYLFPG